MKISEDDSSTDEMRSQLQAKYPLIYYIHQPTQGIVATYNRGLEVAQGEFITFLHPWEVFF